MQETTADRLRRLGIDVGFLEWLEGSDERIPRLDRVRDISGAKLAAAVRAAVWLNSQFAHLDRIAPDTPEQWREEYEILQAFLWNVLRQSMVFHRMERHEDLKALEEVIETLMPSAIGRYRADIQRLRKLGQPVRLGDWAGQTRGQQTGGRRQSEQVERMRAGIEYIASKSRTPYRDLADLWNEQLDNARYDPDSMRQTLRKGQQAGPELLDFWKGIYRGNRWLAFPGEYPRPE